MIAPDIFRQLLGPVGQRALMAAEAAKPGEADFLPVFQRLSRRFPPDLARAAVEQAILRRGASEKFSSADRMYFTRQALEQATPEAVALYRASRFTEFIRLFDFGCGIGGDSLALARVGEVIAIDRDRLRLLLLAANAKALDLEERIAVVQADLRYLCVRFPQNSAAFFDPARRVGYRRIRSVSAYQPPLELSLAWLPQLEGMAIKVGPAIVLDQIAGYDCEVEFVSWRGQLREATLWFGSLMTASSRATVLPGPHSLIGEAEPSIDIEHPKTYLYEPDPAVLRAGLVRTLGQKIGAAQIDPAISYLTSIKLVVTPFARAYRVEEVVPFGLKRLRRVLHARQIGRITIKKRGSAVDTESFRRRLRLHGHEEATVLLTRVDGRHVALIVQPVEDKDRLSMD